MSDYGDIKKAGNNGCPHCGGPSDTPALDAAWVLLPVERRSALLKKLGYTFTQQELDFHGAGLPFVHELPIPETAALERMLFGQEVSSAAASPRQDGYDSGGWRREGEVPSMSGRNTMYLVDSHISGRWRCSCQDYLMRRQYNGTDCKHISLVKEAMGELQSGDGGGA